MPLSLQECNYPADFYRMFEYETDADTRKSSQIRRDTHLSTFVVKLIQEVLALGGGGGGKSLQTGNNKQQAEPPEIVLDSDSSDETTLYDWTTEYEATYLLPIQIRFIMERVLVFAVNAKRVRGLGFDMRHFVTEFCLDVEFPSLELLGLLDAKHKLMSISAYLMRLNSPPKLDYFTKQVISFCFSACLHADPTSARATEILNDILSSVIISGYCNPITETTLQTLKTTCTNILTGITKRLIDDDQFTLHHQFLLAILQDASVIDSIKRKYFSDQLLTLLSLPCDQTLTDTLQYQEKFAADDENQRKQSTISMFLGPPQTKYDVVEVLRRAVRELSSLNWENVLIMISTWEKMCSPDSHEIFILMKDLIRALISIGLNEMKEDEIMIAFILARHCCLIAPVNFSRYEKWFSAMFEHSNSVTNTPEKFTFFIQVMTKWISIEPPSFLQVHVSYRPFIPNGCRPLWAEYSALCKARISEYNEIEAAMQYEPNLQNPTQNEVDMAIREFDASGGIPKSINGMIFFRKPYYVNQFLPLLIRQPSGIVVSDARLRLIEALNIVGKIPANIYAEYKSSLQK